MIDILHYGKAGGCSDKYRSKQGVWVCGLGLMQRKEGPGRKEYIDEEGKQIAMFELSR